MKPRRRATPKKTAKQLRATQPGVESRYRAILTALCAGARQNGQIYFCGGKEMATRIVETANAIIELTEQ